MSPLLLWVGVAHSATLVVDPSDSSAYPTIADALAVAASGDTLSLAAGTHTECVNTGGIDVVLEGPSSGSPAVIDGAGACTSAVVVESGETVTLRNLELANGTGRGVYLANSTLSVEGVTFDGLGGTEHAGGAIYASDATLTLSDSAFTNNTGTEGGAVYLYHGVTFADAGSTFSGNTSSSGSGGAIYAYWNHTVTLDGTTFASNTSAGHGGGMVANWYTAVTFDNTDWTGNSAAGSGGAFYTYVAGETLQVRGSTFVDNHALDGWGGAIENEWASTLFVSDSTFEDNTATAAGGAISQWYETSLAITGSSFARNTASASGGAVYFNPYQGRVDDLYIERSHFEDNTSGSWGGAVYGNQAQGIAVQGTTFHDNVAAGNGGGLAVYVATTIDITGSRFCGNEAALGGGAQLEWAGEDTVQNTQFIDNTAVRGGGLFRYASYAGHSSYNTFVGNSADTWGGAYVDEWGASSLLSSAFFHNSGGAIFTEFASTAAATPVRYGAWGDNADVDGAGYFWVELGDDGNITGDPMFAAYTPGADCATQDVHPMAGSVLIDAADPSEIDLDGSAADIGAFGGRLATVEDHDDDGFSSSEDCLDGDASVHPDADELCDGIDNDCDGTVDGSDALDATRWFLDLDGDGFGDPTTEVVGCGGSGMVTDGTDCDDTAPDVFPGAEDAWYDGIDANCDGASDHDADGDGHDKPVGDNGGRDCDDTDPTTHPGADDTPGDGVDQDCDGADDVEVHEDSDSPVEPEASDTDKGSGCMTGGLAPLGLVWLVVPVLAGRRRG